MAELSSAARIWDFEVERGPGWLFVRPRRVGADSWLAMTLAECVWSLMEQSLTRRVVLELAEIERLDSDLIAELDGLHQRILEHDGVMRICGLSAANDRLLRASRLESHLPSFRDREEAVMACSRPTQPR